MKPIVLYILLIIKYSFIFYVCFIFFIDVFIFNYLSYFYKSLVLLFIPLIIDLLLFMIYNLAKKNSSIIKEWINFIPNKTGDWCDMRLNIDNQENPLLNIKDEETLLKIMTIHYWSWFYYVGSCMTIDNLYYKEKKIKPYINIVIYSIYSMGWGYILIKIFLIEFF